LIRIIKDDGLSRIETVKDIYIDDALNYFSSSVVAIIKNEA
jgi:hypothetical protein